MYLRVTSFSLQLVPTAEAIARMRRRLHGLVQHFDASDDLIQALDVDHISHSSVPERQRVCADYRSAGRLQHDGVERRSLEQCPTRARRLGQCLDRTSGACKRKCSGRRCKPLPKGEGRARFERASSVNWLHGYPTLEYRPEALREHKASFFSTDCLSVSTMRFPSGSALEATSRRSSRQGAILGHLCRTEWLT